MATGAERCGKLPADSSATTLMPLEKDPDSRSVRLGRLPDALPAICHLTQNGIGTKGKARIDSPPRLRWRALVDELM